MLVDNLNRYTMRIMESYQNYLYYVYNIYHIDILSTVVSNNNLSIVYIVGKSRDCTQSMDFRQGVIKWDELVWGGLNTREGYVVALTRQ